jgi:hypothetical protein
MRSPFRHRRWILLFPTFSAYPAAPAISVAGRGHGRRRRRKEAGRRRGALGRHPQQPHSPRLAEAVADPHPEAHTTCSGYEGGRGGGLVEGGTGRAEGDGAAHGVEELVETAYAGGFVAPHGAAVGGERRESLGTGSSGELGIR